MVNHFPIFSPWRTISFVNNCPMGRAPWETPNDPGPALEAGTRLWHHWLHQYAVWPQRRVFGVRIYQFYSVLLQPGEVSSDSGILILFNVDMFFFRVFLLLISFVGTSGTLLYLSEAMIYLPVSSD